MRAKKKKIFDVNSTCIEPEYIFRFHYLILSIFFFALDVDVATCLLHQVHANRIQNKNIALHVLPHGMFCVLTTFSSLANEMNYCKYII